jgi:hypothetical protein
VIVFRHANERVEQCAAEGRIERIELLGTVQRERRDGISARLQDQWSGSCIRNDSLSGFKP